MAARPQERDFQEEGKLAREKAEEGVGCLPSYPHFSLTQQALCELLWVLLLDEVVCSSSG